MTIDERIERDAAQWRHDDHAPSLDDYLVAAVRPRWGRAHVWLAMGAAAVLAVSLVVSFWPRTTHQRPASHRHQHSTPPVTVRPLAHVPFVAAIPDPRDPRKIYAMWTDSGGPLCSPSQVHLSHLEETPTAVHVVLAGVLVDDHLTHGCTAPGYRPVAVQLRAPLGVRIIYDANAARTLFDASRIPSPGYLPPGYHGDPARNVDSPERLSTSRAYRSSGHRFINVSYAAAATPYAYL
jgi:hypothetical protein